MAIARRLVEAVVEAPQIRELTVEAREETGVARCPGRFDSVLGVRGEAPDQLGHQQTLAAEMVVDVGPGGADRFGDVSDRIYRSLRQDLSVPRLAEMAAMSPRNFTRVFRAELGLAPAQFVRALRVDVARRLLAQGGGRLGAVARECGFASEEQMWRAFKAVLKPPPRKIVSGE